MIIWAWNRKIALYYTPMSSCHSIFNSSIIYTVHCPCMRLLLKCIHWSLSLFLLYNTNTHHYTRILLSLLLYSIWYIWCFVFSFLFFVSDYHFVFFFQFFFYCRFYTLFPQIYAWWDIISINTKRIMDLQHCASSLYRPYYANCIRYGCCVRTETSAVPHLSHTFCCWAFHSGILLYTSIISVYPYGYRLLRCWDSLSFILFMNIVSDAANAAIYDASLY